jgi:hypothetical protein
MTEASKRWIEAAKVLAADKTATVACPECREGTLRVIDERFSFGVLTGMVDRYLTCDLCGKWEVVTFKEQPL